MPFEKRYDFPGARHHVMSRGVRKTDIYTGARSREHFLELLALMVERYPVAVHGFVLMGNHFHLMVESLDGELGKAMHFLLGAYAKWMNAFNGWEGALFQGRYRNRVVEHEADWAHLLAYLHLNPVRSHWVSDPRVYDWSSLGSYLEPSSRPPWLVTEEQLAIHGGPGGHLAYLEGVMGGEPLEPEGWEERVLWREGATGTMTSLASMNSLERGLKEVLAILGCIRLDELEPSEKMAAAWWLATTTRGTMREIGEKTGSSKATISRWARRGSDALGSSGRVQELIDGFGAAWTRGQEI